MITPYQKQHAREICLDEQRRILVLIIRSHHLHHALKGQMPEGLCHHDGFVHIGRGHPI